MLWTPLTLIALNTIYDSIYKPCIDHEMIRMCNVWIFGWSCRAYLYESPEGWWGLILKQTELNNYNWLWNSLRRIDNSFPRSTQFVPVAAVAQWVRAFTQPAEGKNN